MVQTYGKMVVPNDLGEDLEPHIFQKIKLIPLI